MVINNASAWGRVSWVRPAAAAELTADDRARRAALAASQRAAVARARALADLASARVHGR
jgi:hypothetical protein